MIINPITSEETEARTSVRSHIRLAGRVQWDCTDASADIINLSEWGALIKSDRLPNVGLVVRLICGTNTVKGTTAWVDSKRFGVRFERQISIRDWLSPQTPSFDETTCFDETTSRHNPDRPSLESRLLGDLNLVSRLVDDLVKALTPEPETAHTHSGKLQNLDCAIQMLASACWAVSDRARSGDVL